jgi:hypothetical protein
VLESQCKVHPSRVCETNIPSHGVRPLDEIPLIIDSVFETTIKVNITKTIAKIAITIVILLIYFFN